MAKDRPQADELNTAKQDNEPKIRLVNPADVQAVVFMAGLPIIGFQRKDEDIAFDLGDGHKITVGMIRQVKQLLGE